MSVPAYIYFEEHHPVESYDLVRRKLKTQSGLRPFGSQSQKCFTGEEVKQEGGCNKPNPPLIGNFVQAQQ